MRKRIAIRPVEPIILEFSDGTIKEVAINNEALMYITEQFGDIGNLLETEMEHPYELASKILYGGMKVMDTTTTLEEAKAIMVGGGIELVIEMFNALSENFGALSNDEVKKSLAPAFLKMLEKRAKI